MKRKITNARQTMIVIESKKKKKNENKLLTHIS